MYDSTDSYNDILNKVEALNVNSYNNVALFNHSKDSNDFHMIESDKCNLNDLNSWNNYFNFWKNIKNSYNVNNIDLLACDIYSNNKWKMILEKNGKSCRMYCKIFR